MNKSKDEAQLQSSIIEWLYLHDIFHWRNNTGALKIGNRFVKFGFKGSPDIICVYRGWFIGIECKSATGRQSANQEDFEKKLKEAGGAYLLVKNIDTVINYFEDLFTVAS